MMGWFIDGTASVFPGTRTHPLEEPGSLPQVQGLTGVVDPAICKSMQKLGEGHPLSPKGKRKAQGRAQTRAKTQEKGEFIKHTRSGPREPPGPEGNPPQPTIEAEQHHGLCLTIGPGRLTNRGRLSARTLTED